MTSSKVIVAIRGDGPSRTDADVLVERCAEAGATRVQVNPSDDAVSGAMRIDELDPPIGAVLSFWAPDPGPVLAVVDDGLDGPIAAWAVTDRAPLNPNLPADGTRIDALSNVAFLRRPDELDRDEWLRRWLDDHTQVAIDTQATFGYVQNIVERPLTEDTPPVAAIVEELFPMAAVSDIHAFYGSGGDQRELERRMTLMLESVSRFGADRHLDVVPTSRYDFDLSRPRT
ncbi:EthD domain-containing protein [Gordonia sp. WA4-43]|uniref:EthD domain-containing protein n=1 Tax=Gordonia sp. WA4-43 TaxID=2878678 RepID=UPI001CFA6D9A|nr:EthD domain-containing protein [Gordonia sp. WA4-43]UCZ88236.1 EthD domain-containing protein [Gordonia sp. WA4-43]